MNYHTAQKMKFSSISSDETKVAITVSAYHSIVELMALYILELFRRRFRCFIDKFHLMLILNQELKTVKNVDCLINTLKCTQLQFMKCFLF